MNTIHERAMVGKHANLGCDNTIGPNVIIEDGATLGSNNVIGPGAVIFKGTTLGDGNVVHTGTVIGDIPQDTGFKGGDTFVNIGNGNRIREYCTIHRGTKEGSVTSIGDNTFLMGYTHVAHNCRIGNNVVAVNTSVLGGYVVVENNAFISASVVIHQFCRIGAFAMLSGLTAVNKDVPPYVTCGGRPAVAIALNVIGLRRAVFKPETRAEIKKAFKLLYFSGLNVSQAIEAIQKESRSPEVDCFVEFIKKSERGIISKSHAEEDSGYRL